VERAPDVDEVQREQREWLELFCEQFYLRVAESIEDAGTRLHTILSDALYMEVAAHNVTAWRKGHAAYQRDALVARLAGHDSKHIMVLHGESGAPSFFSFLNDDENDDAALLHRSHTVIVRLWQDNRDGRRRSQMQRSAGRGFDPRPIPRHEREVEHRS
jgi:hypothetical protein